MSDPAAPVVAAPEVARDAHTVLTYQPSDKQNLFHASNAKYRLLLGAWGSGKTTMLVWEDILLALEYPGSTGVVYRKTYPALRDTTKRDYLDACPVELVKDHVKSEGREEILFQNGSRTLFRCLDDYKKLGSTQFDRISIDEAWEVTADEFRTLAFGRLRGKKGPRRIMLATNPPNRDHWLYEFFVKEAAEDPDRACFHYATYDNAQHLPPEYISKLEQMPEQWKKKFLRGEWGILVTGTPVFRDFRADLHVVPHAKAIPGLPIIRGWDFGFQHPAAVFLQIAPSGHITVLHEMLGTHVDLYSFANQVIQAGEDRWPGTAYVDFCDVAGTQQHDTGPAAVAVLRRNFHIFPRFRKLDRAQSLLRLQYLLGHIPQGIPLLRFDKSCRLLIEACEGGYVFDDKADGPEPKKDNYYEHVVDALRYALAHQTVAATSPYAGRPLPRSLLSARL